MYLPKKISWTLLTAYFFFDNVLSYWAVVYRGGRELNSVIALYVEQYPILYFLCIPLELLVVYVIVRILKRWFDEKILLTAAAIYWPIANSSLNLLFLFGFRGQGYLWGPLTGIGVSIALVYIIIASYARK